MLLNCIGRHKRWKFYFLERCSRCPAPHDVLALLWDCLTCAICHSRCLTSGTWRSISKDNTQIAPIPDPASHSWSFLVSCPNSCAFPAVFPSLWIDLGCLEYVPLISSPIALSVSSSPPFPLTLYSSSLLCFLPLSLPPLPSPLLPSSSIAAILYRGLFALLNTDLTLLILHRQRFTDSSHTGLRASCKAFLRHDRSFPSIPRLCAPIYQSLRIVP